jgi:hypothetical protein
VTHVVDVVLKVLRIRWRRESRDERRRLKVNRRKVDPLEPRMTLDLLRAISLNSSSSSSTRLPSVEEPAATLLQDDRVGTRGRRERSARTDPVFSLADEEGDEVLSFARDARLGREAEGCSPLDDLRREEGSVFVDCLTNKDNIPSGE